MKSWERESHRGRTDPEHTGNPRKEILRRQFKAKFKILNGRREEKQINLKNQRRENPGAALYGQALEQSQNESIRGHKLKKGGGVVEELEAALYGQAQKFRK